MIVPVESDEAIRIISLRKADSNETDLFDQNAGYFGRRAEAHASGL